MVLTVICCNQGYCSKSASTIATMSRMHRNGVYNSIKKLQELGLIRVEMINSRRWKIWPMISKHSTSGVLSQKGHSTNGVTHSTPAQHDIAHGVCSNNNLTLKEQGDLKIDPEITAEQMRKFGLTLKVVP